MAMSRIQQLFTRFVPRSWAASMEEESRAWMVRCPHCGYERSVWDLGGIRWKASGKKRIWARCPHCGQRGWHVVYRRAETEPASAT
jgi:DNA-directed RNA polymerase subunit RPC12/RpoP